jgi:hypothetical protein
MWGPADVAVHAWSFATTSVRPLSHSIQLNGGVAATGPSSVRRPARTSTAWTLLPTLMFGPLRVGELKFGG